MDEDEMPRIGETVHYTSYGSPGGEFKSVCRAASVTEVPWEDIDGEERVSIAVLNPTGMFFNTDVAHNESRVGGTWHWPHGRNE